MRAKEPIDWESAMIATSASDIPIGCVAGFWLASIPMKFTPYRHQIASGFTQKAWNMRSFLVLSQLERRVPERT
jgi:hypothetical protein